ncbi:uncharacterized protein A4U43_C01F11870 [Asparagus officinalis]|uniref:Uncharacterized protein n=1 Tax=Asparagus officinalis TaxID=4686 RepID=A0A5P1FPH2_ASPOF|nr:uncharacterized protein A4U43_C01F11870 [Asparagus officinalis]
MLKPEVFEYGSINLPLSTEPAASPSKNLSSGGVTWSLPWASAQDKKVKSGSHVVDFWRPVVDSYEGSPSTIELEELLLASPLKARTSSSLAINLIESSIDGALVRDSPNNPITIEAKVRLAGDNEEDDIAKARSAL